MIAGALSSIVPKGPISRLLGREAPLWQSYPAAAFGGFVLAVCSCTVMPLFAGIYKGGAGLGPAVTFLFVGPAINILALSLTSIQLGPDLAFWRLVLSITFGILIGLAMAAIFRQSESAHKLTTLVEPEAPDRPSGRSVAVVMLLLLGLLAGGTLQVPVLSSSVMTIEPALSVGSRVQALLDSLLPANGIPGTEKVTVHGALIILMLLMSAAAGWRGFGRIEETPGKWSYLALAAFVSTVIIASLDVRTTDHFVSVSITGRTVILGALCGVLAVFSSCHVSSVAIADWIRETWRFSAQIVPLLLAGVFIAGAVRLFIPATWVQSAAGDNTLLSNLTGVLFGVFMYFPTLVEVPVAQTFLSLGMHKGPLLAYLMSDPELSFQSMLVTGSVIGRKKTIAYVLLVVVFSTLAGYFFGMAQN